MSNKKQKIDEENSSHINRIISEKYDIELELIKQIHKQNYCEYVISYVNMFKFIERKGNLLSCRLGLSDNNRYKYGSGLFNQYKDDYPDMYMMIRYMICQIYPGSQVTFERKDHVYDRLGYTDHSYDYIDVILSDEGIKKHDEIYEGNNNSANRNSKS